MGSWHPLAPDILTMAEEHAGVEIEKRATISAPMDPKVPVCLCHSIVPDAVALNFWFPWPPDSRSATTASLRHVARPVCWAKASAVTAMAQPANSMRRLPQLTRGMNGALLLTGGEACPAVVPAPFDLGPDLSTNAVVAAGFRLPAHQLHAPR
jgi:hypothetical protein